MSRSNIKLNYIGWIIFEISEQLEIIQKVKTSLTIARGFFLRADTVKAKAARGRGRRARASHGKATGIVLRL